MAHRKPNNYQGSYQQYSNKFAAVRNQGRLHKTTKKFTKRQFDRMRAEGTTVDEMIEKQSISVEKAEKAFEQYKYLRDNSLMRPGNKFNSNKEWKNSYFGETGTEDYQLGYHRTLSGFLKDGHAMHFMITFEIDMGFRSREDILDDYGYND